MLIDNKIYKIEYDICGKCLYLDKFLIKEKYRGRKYSYRIIKSLKDKYNLPIILICFWTLIEFYKKLGFEINGNLDNDNYIEMILK